MRRLGAASVDLCHVAMGIVDGEPETPAAGVNASHTDIHMYNHPSTCMNLLQTLYRSPRKSPFTIT